MRFRNLSTGFASVIVQSLCSRAQSPATVPSDFAGNGHADIVYRNWILETI
jgi:hypothetical protein